MYIYVYMYTFRAFSAIFRDIFNKEKYSHGYLRSCNVHVDNFWFFIFQLMRTNYYKMVKLLKSFKIIIVAPTCFGLHKPSSGSSQPVLHPKLQC